MTNNDPISLPVPAFFGGTKAITLTPVVGSPKREYAEMFIPGAEQLEDGELRVTVLGSGNPWNTRLKPQPVSWSKSATRRAISWFLISGVVPRQITPV